MRKIFFLISVLLCVVSSQMTPGVAVAADDAHTLFVKAGLAYKNADYEGAIHLYEKILQKNFVSGALYYNLANSYFKKGQLGESLLYYERARRLLPRDSDVLSNYKLALSRKEHNYPLPRKTLLQRMVENGMAYYTVNEFIILTVFFSVLSGALVLAALFFNWSRRKYLPISIVCLTLTMVCLISFTIKQTMGADQAIAVTSAEVFFEPREEATVHFTLKEGEKVRILKQEGLWLKIERPDQKVGWVALKTVERI